MAPGGGLCGESVSDDLLLVWVLKHLLPEPVGSVWNVLVVENSFGQRRLPGKKCWSTLSTAFFTSVIGYQHAKLFAALLAPVKFFDRVANGAIIVSVIARNPHQRYQGDAALANVERQNER